MRSVVRAALLAVVLATLAMLAIVVAGWSPRVEYIVSVAVVAAFAGVSLRTLLRAAATPTWPSPVPRPADAPGVDPRVGAIETSLRRATDDAAVCRRRVQPLLFDLATHRLRRQHGIGLVEDPESARSLLGDDAFRFLTDVVDAPAPVATIAGTVDAVERL